MEEVNELPDTSSYKASIEDTAKAFLEFQYVEAKDLTKHFLTVIATVLTVSVTFSDKILNVNQVSKAASVSILIAWVMFIGAFIAAGAALYLLFNAGAAAKRTLLTRQKIVFDFYNSKNTTYWGLMSLAYKLLNIAGIIFVVGLGLLIMSGAIKIMNNL